MGTIDLNIPRDPLPPPLLKRATKRQIHSRGEIIEKARAKGESWKRVIRANLEDIFQGADDLTDSDTSPYSSVNRFTVLFRAAYIPGLVAAFNFVNPREEDLKRKASEASYDAYSISEVYYRASMGRFDLSFLRKISS